jgi:hypothetical protein
LLKTDAAEASPCHHVGNVANVTKVVLSMQLVRSSALLCDWLRIQLDGPSMMKSWSG